MINPCIRNQNQATCQNKDKNEERFISFTSVCRDLDFMKEMKYPEDTIESMKSIMLGASSTGKRSISDNDKKDPKKEDGLFDDLLNLGKNLIQDGDGIIDVIKDGVEGLTNSVISGKGALNYQFLSDCRFFCLTLLYLFYKQEMVLVRRGTFIVTTVANALLLPLLLVPFV